MIIVDYLEGCKYCSHNFIAKTRKKQKNEKNVRNLLVATSVLHCMWFIYAEILFDFAFLLWHVYKNMNVRSCARACVDVDCRSFGWSVRRVIVSSTYHHVVRCVMFTCILHNVGPICVGVRVQSIKISTVTNESRTRALSRVCVQYTMNEYWWRVCVCGACAFQF